jgi:hypothetical protein
MTAIQNLKLAIKKLGIGGTIHLLAQKRAKRKRLAALLHETLGSAKLITAKNISIEISDKERTTIIERADELLNDENYLFTFSLHLKGMPDLWNYDPIEKKYWQKKGYEETQVHSADTPRDVKIVWEINRFKYLPLLAQAAYITKKKKYADEVEARILSWIDDNPFAGSINWSSPLEIAIRAISWTASLHILFAAGFDISKNEKIARSIWQHAAYLNAELSTDKIVRSNHLIGETAGLYILSSFFDFPEAVFFRIRAKKTLTDSILEQTYPDGGTQESSGWYHTFITDFADLALRSANTIDDSFDEKFSERFHEMSIYRNSIILPDGDAVKFGDCDFGKAINLSAKWKDFVFGENHFISKERKEYFEITEHITSTLDKNYLFVRAGDFGWGGDGFSSHAHDDFLSPIVAMDGVNILVDPGTYAYNGAPHERDNERTAVSHNGLIITDHESRSSEPRLKPSFGWIKTRPASFIEKYDTHENEIFAQATYGEFIGEHERVFRLHRDEFILEDLLHFKFDKSLEWNFHFHPRWRLEKIGAQKFVLRDYVNNQYEFELSGIDAELELLRYDFYPSYMRKSGAWKLRMRSSIRADEERNVTFILRKLSL